MSVVLQFPFAQELNKMNVVKANPIEPKISGEIVIFPIKYSRKKNYLAHPDTMTPKV